MSAPGGDASDPHDGQPVEHAGVPLEDAERAVVLVHGRGARAQGMLQFAEDLPSENTAFVAPQAARSTWYPKGFMEPMPDNEPWLSSALDFLGDTIADVTEHVSVERTALLGFSQGACLSSEYVARNAREYGGLVVFSGGLIGPEGTPRDYDGSLDGTPAFLGCGDRDQHIPVERVHETTEALEALDADVTERIYEGMSHGVNEDELEHASDLFEDL
ncbi:alpha/beta hydrolase [Halobacterium zhouii]|uniref:alpha/beta hydrolase n=1 Tax=Halobacterium zhouii TaxID=2902624 RepID=UPI001E4EF7D0|nr:dienelactone hydrolase family protein [Halobacterium zhouii]